MDTTELPTPTVWQIPTTIAIDSELVADLLDTAGYAIDYWALVLPPRDGKQEVAVELDEPLVEGGPTIVRASYEKVATCLVGVANGTLQCRGDLRHHANEAITGNDTGEIDSELADVVLQYALFGELVFG